MPAKPSDAVVLAWARLVRAEQAVLGAIELELKQVGFPPLGWYDVLLELTRAPDRRLRPLDIERQTLLAQYSLSRLLDRLEGESLVRREPCDVDGRGHWIVLTDAGSDLQRRMWKVYARAIQRHVGDKLNEESAARLSDLLGRLVGAAKP